MPKLKSKKSYDYECDEDGNMTEKFLVSYVQYNEAGNSIREEIYENDEINILVEHIYEGALLLKTTQTDYVNQMQQNWEYKYDEKGRKIEQREIYEGGGYAGIQFEYDDNDKILSELFIDDEEVISGKVQYTYDERGNLLDKTEYDGDDFTKPWISTSYKYDDKNNVIQKNDNFSEQPPTCTLYEYNEAGDLDYAKVFYTDNNDIILEQTTLEDDDGNIIGMEMLYPKQGLKKESIVKTNDKNQLIEEEVFTNDNLSSTRKVNYNKHGEKIEEKVLDLTEKNFSQWSGEIFELEYWKNEEEE